MAKKDRGVVKKSIVPPELLADMLQKIAVNYLLDRLRNKHPEIFKNPS